MESLTTGKPTCGTITFILSGPKKGAFPFVDQPKEEPRDPEVKGTPEDFVAKHGKEALVQLKNKVKKCPSCGKVNAFTLNSCNSCGTSLSEVKISYPNNVFAGFVYGIQKGPFPFTISIRLQTKSLLVFDDLMALTPCHVNCIPTDCYVPDIRVLFENPERGLKLVNAMDEANWSVVSQFLDNKEWREKIIRGKVDEKEFRKHIITGFNYPPSQYWLHLQCMAPPMLPFHNHMYNQGRHFTFGRFFPLQYVKMGLKLGKITSAGEMKIEEIIKILGNRGLDYNTVWREEYGRYGESQKALANWKASDFQRVIVNGKSVADVEDLKILEVNPVDALKEDKMDLQNYGRPYIGGRPKGNYYKYPATKLLPKFL